MSCRPSASLVALWALWAGLGAASAGGAVAATEGSFEGPADRGQEPVVWVELNERPLATAVRLGRGQSAEGVFVRLGDLQRAVDGEAPPERTRLHLTGGKLYAVALGGCDACTVQVRRTVLISSRVRLVGREPYVPLDDVVRAFEARLERDPGRGVYGIFAGACNWCILEPKRAGE